MEAIGTLSRQRNRRKRRFFDQWCCETEFKIILQYKNKNHHWIFRNVWCEFRKIVSHGQPFIIARTKNIPWNITRNVHKIRTALKRRWIFQAYIGKSLFSGCGLIPASSKRSSGSNGGGVNPISAHPRTKSNNRKDERLRKNRIWIMITGWHTWKRHYSKRLRQHDKGTAKKREQRNGRENSRLVALHLPQKLQICELDDTRAIRTPQADYSTKNDEPHKNFYTSTIHLYRGWSTMSLLYCTSWTRSKKKRSEWSCTGDVHTRTKGRQTFPPPWEV